MSLVSFTPVVNGATATAASVNTPFSTIYNDYNGNITDANISASAAIASTKVAITQATMSNPYKFSAYAATSPVITSSTWTKAVLDTENFDTGSNFDSTTNYRFTAPVTGFYFISWRITLTSAGATAGVPLQGALYKNGAMFTYGGAIGASGTNATVPALGGGDLYRLTAGDYLEVFGYIGEASRAILGGAVNTYMTGFLVSAT